MNPEISTFATSTSPRSRSRRARLAPWPLATLVAALLGIGTTAARADDEFAAAPFMAVVDVEIDTLASTVVDPTVFATLLPNPDVAKRSLIQSAIAAAMALQANAKPASIVPISAPVNPNPNARPIRIDAGIAASTPSMLLLDSGQLVQVHADGMPSANGPDRDPLVRVMPRAVNPADVTFGARWGAEDRIQAPLLSQLAWDAHADVVSGAPPARAGNVRRSLRVTAQWDTPEDLTIGFTPGVQRGGGMAFEHYVAGLQVSTVDKTQAARWRSYVEVSGEKLTPSNIIDNCTAQVHAGATYLTSTSTSLDISVSRGTTATSDLQSSVGLSMHF